MHLSTLHFGPRRFLHEEEERIRTQVYRHIRVRPVSPSIGAEVEGVDLGRLDDDSFREIRRAHLDFKVLFFRDQDISTAAQLAFAARFGELEEHPFLPANPDAAEVVRFAKDDQVVGVENTWHSDVSWREIPSLGSVLRAVQVPDVGGDTLFSDMVAAYQGLPDEVKKEIENWRAVHDFSHSFGVGMSPDTLAAQREKYPPVEHPVVRTHPETGQKILYVNAIFTSHIVGLPRDESDRWLDFLFRQSHFPEYQCRFQWRPGSVAFWDNRSVQHYASSDYWPKTRVMDRATIIGDRPA
ncbi:MAG: TauD/TfdA family dioxygenase [Proteobacteria bacterium]|nr:TauD/TfdA family dioxygenase [Pseudomonadota bacterium]